MDPMTAIIIGIVIGLVLFSLCVSIGKATGLADDGKPWPHGMMKGDEDEHRWI